MGGHGGLVRLVGPGRGARAMLPTLALLVLGGASAQEGSSCVQVSYIDFLPSCTCDAGSDFIFAMRGETTVVGNVVRKLRGHHWEIDCSGE